MFSQGKQIITSEQILLRRKELLQSENLILIEVFDTFEKESGKKDVVLAKTRDGEKRIVRIGESRPSSFFLDGFEGEHILVPRIFLHSQENIPFEIEEFCEGEFFSDLNTKCESSGELRLDLLEKLLLAFWEFQRVGGALPFSMADVEEKMKKFFARVQNVLEDSAVIEKILKQHAEFYRGAYPSKWKFSLDNLILTKNNKVVFIDNVHAGKRFFGYDLGWIIWPLWVHMKTKEYDQLEEYFLYLENFQKKLKNSAPNDFSHQSLLEQGFWLVVLERIIGALFDLENNTKHLKSFALDKEGDLFRRAKHTQFLRDLLKITLERIS